jgi:hypothetical protein
MSNELRQDIGFRELYPTLTDEELKQAETNFCRYLAIVWDIQKEQVSRADDGAVDTSAPSSTMKERSNVSLTN